jgi:hypothetical protein
LVTILAAPGTMFQEIDRVTFKAAIRRVLAKFGVEGSTKQSLTTTVPPGAVTGPIRVTNASGSDLTSMPFIVLGDPTSPLPGTEVEE